MDLPTIRGLLAGAWIAAEGTTLREEDEKKALELVGFLREAAHLLRPSAKRRTVVDAAAGKGYVGLLLARLGHRVTLLERDPKRVESLCEAASRLDVASRVVAKACDVADLAAWPEAPWLVASLHACGDATDRTLAGAIASRARHVLVAPCCVAAQLDAATRASAHAERLGIAHFSEAKRRVVEGMVLGERALVLEAAGYKVEPVAFVPPTVSPYNVALRGTRVDEPARRARAEVALRRLRSPGAPRRADDS